ncbi:cobalamin B12-binding protein [Novosphingobium sp. THN1]|uniref:cobalamin B12-binding domain-containing protein n=1 Tax=Novosphingobium sp. THN1 TaxID=1016987 RepID=UPI000E4ED482|nr:B12-binding domain-containing protein [Novosphingobium sp. THN1]AXU17889.1 cobalamin B12-binding protein [Novosphingobium sp. THN1]
MIEEQIIPRLLLAHSSGVPKGRVTGTLSVDPSDAASFASLPLDLDAEELLEVVEGFIARGIAIESIFVDLLAPSARRLGQHWEEDECDFLDVTMGLWRLQEVMRQVALRFPADDSDGDRARSALFSPMPGDRHALGTLMIEEVFARAGWQTEALIEPKRKELLQIIAERHFDVIGLTVSCDCTNANLSDLICSIRSVSRTPGFRSLLVDEWSMPIRVSSMKWAPMAPLPMRDRLSFLPKSWLPGNTPDRSAPNIPSDSRLD